MIPSDDRPRAATELNCAPGLCFIRGKSREPLKPSGSFSMPYMAFLFKWIQKHRQQGVTNPSDGVFVCLKVEELNYFRDCEEGDVQ